MAEENWSDWHPFEGHDIGWHAPSDLGGVYEIADEEANVVYIGMAESLLERLGEHASGSSDQAACIREAGGKQFRFLVIEDSKERETFEGVLLNLVDPPCNG